MTGHRPDDYDISTEMFRLLAAFGSTNDRHYMRVLDDVMASPQARDVLNMLVGFGFGAVLSRFNGDTASAVAYLCGELQLQHDLAHLDTADLEPGGAQ